MTYEIQKGNHYSLHMPRPSWFFKSIDFKFKFDYSCLYRFHNDDKHDINKLYGISFGHHHTNSIRLGWNCSYNNLKIQLYTYYYINGKRCVIYLCDVDVDVEYQAIIGLEKNRANIQVGDRYLSFRYNRRNTCNLGYYLYPYFGGNNVAPHDMLISIK